VSPVCLTGMANYNPNGKDVVYRYTPATTGSFTVEVTPTGWDCALWYNTSACGTDGGNCLGASDLGYNGTVERLVVSGVAGTAYYLYVSDAYSTSSSGGPFSIVVK